MNLAAVDKRIVFDDEGEPLEVVIPYRHFVELAEAYGFDLEVDEQRELREALADLAADRRSAFVSEDAI
ncbi:MAG: hypothetical protein GWQ05_21975 [Verrucomicrobiaceae bacterium]|nr:hypothetical protein [Verrucomicrobiaceae bacterium]